jgi:hypothetical protein
LGLAATSQAQDDDDAASRQYEEARRLYAVAGNLVGQADCLFGLGLLARRGVKSSFASEYFREARILYDRVMKLTGVAKCDREIDLTLAVASVESADGIY